MNNSFISFVTIIALLIAIPYSVRAQVVTDTPETTITPTTSTTTQKIEDLKERLATKVAELRQTQQRAMFGTVKAVTITTLTIETLTRDVKLELKDDVRIFQDIKGKRTELTTDSLAEGDIVSVFGQFDTTLNLLTPAVIIIQAALPLKVHGTVTAVDTTAFTIELLTSDNQTYTIDVEKTTKTNVWDSTKGIIKGGFSKVTTGDILHVTGVVVPKQTNRISAQRLVDLGTLQAATPIPSLSSSPTASASPTRIIRSSPTPTQTQP